MFDGLQNLSIASKLVVNAAAIDLSNVRENRSNQFQFGSAIVQLTADQAVKVREILDQIADGTDPTAIRDRLLRVEETNREIARDVRKRNFTILTVLSAVVVAVGVAALAAIIGCAVAFSMPITVPLLVGTGIAAGIIITGASGVLGNGIARATV